MGTGTKISEYSTRNRVVGVWEPRVKLPKCVRREWSDLDGRKSGCWIMCPNWGVKQRKGVPSSPLLFTEMWSEHELEFGISKIGTVKRKLAEIARAPVGRTDALVVRTSCGAKRPPVYDPSRSDYKPMLVRPLFRHAIPTILGFGDPPNSNWGSLHSI